jgi:hypothetical protein
MAHSLGVTSPERSGESVGDAHQCAGEVGIGARV